ncbi:MAG: tol-pal system-associated acyl-CoA thioesterase [Rhodocyclaceae bacterium]|jgi:acyl-CoA thioester hydrolase|nr:tol-pal system-associated acyl-CoA thioesterase [Rhodocyclaceae bacterium]MCL4757977.1 tol-pal system-associated acyl-CoA thioesterase [Rhodocyclaceae bacterium]
MSNPEACAPPPRTESGGSALTVRVYYEDTDAAGVVYYANYLRYCERARTEWLRTLGYSQQALLENHAIAFVVRSIEAQFLAPARLDDTLEIMTTVLRLGGASLSFSQRIVRNHSPIFTAQVGIACVDQRSGRPIPIPSGLKTRIRTTLQEATP